MLELQVIIFRLLYIEKETILINVDQSIDLQYLS